MHTLGGIFLEIEPNTNPIAVQLLHWTIIQVQEYAIYSNQRTDELTNERTSECIAFTQ